MSKHLEDFVQQHRSEFDVLEPSKDVLQRIQLQIVQPNTKKKGIVVAINYVRWAAAATIILLAGFGVYSLVKPTTTVIEVARKQPNASPTIVKQKELPTQEQSTNTVVVAEHNQKNNEQLVLMNAIVQAEKAVLFAQMNNMESASQRYSAMVNAAEHKKIDRDIVDALLESLNTDPNSNVRLAAMEALSKFYREPYVKKGLIKSMSTQKDPIVQVTLIDLLTKMRTTSIVNELKKLTEDNNTSELVKDQAYSSLFKLSL